MAGAQYYDQITDGNKAQGIPSGSSATNQGYVDMLNLLANTDDYKYNILLTISLSMLFSNRGRECTFFERYNPTQVLDQNRFHLYTHYITDKDL